MTKSCRKCGTEVEASAKECPKCGAMNPGLSNMQMIFSSSILLVITVLILYLFFGGESNDKSNVTANNYSRTPEQEIKRCINNFNDCNLALIAKSYDGVVPESMAAPDSQAEAISIVVACTALAGNEPVTYSDRNSLIVAQNVLSKGICEGDIDNYVPEK